MSGELSKINEGIEGIDQLLELVLAEIRGIDLKALSKEPKGFDEKWETIRDGVANILVDAKELGVTKEHISTLKNELVEATTPYENIFVGITEQNKAARFMGDMKLLRKLIETLDQAIETLQERFGLDDLIDAQEKRMKELRNELLDLIKEMHWLKGRRNRVEIKKIQRALDTKTEIEEKGKKLAEKFGVNWDESTIGKESLAEIARTVEEIFVDSLEEADGVDDQEEKRKLHIDTIIPENVLNLLLSRSKVTSVDELLGAFGCSQYQIECETEDGMVKIKTDIPISEKIVKALEKKHKQPLSVIAERLKYENIVRRVRERKFVELLKSIEKEIGKQGQRISANWRLRGKLGKTTGRNVVVIPEIQMRIIDVLIERESRGLTESLLATGNEENTISEEDLQILVDTLAEHIAKYNEENGGLEEEEELADYAEQVTTEVLQSIQGGQDLRDVLVNRFGDYIDSADAFGNSDQLMEFVEISRMKRRYLKADKTIQEAMGEIIQNAKQWGVAKSTLESLQQIRIQGGEAFLEEAKERETSDIEEYIRTVGFTELGGIFSSYKHLRRIVEAQKAEAARKRKDREEDEEENSPDEQVLVDPVKELKLMMLSPQQQIEWMIQHEKFELLDVWDMNAREAAIREWAKVGLWTEEKRNTKKPKTKKLGIRPEAYTRKTTKEVSEDARMEQKVKKRHYIKMVAPNVAQLAGEMLIQFGNGKISKTTDEVKKGNGKFAKEAKDNAMKDTARIPAHDYEEEK